MCVHTHHPNVQVLNSSGGPRTVVPVRVRSVGQINLSENY